METQNHKTFNQNSESVFDKFLGDPKYSERAQAFKELHEKLKVN